MSYVHGLVHPLPFSDEPNSTRHKNNFIDFNLYIDLINTIFKKKYPVNLKRVIFFLSLVSIGSYLYALGRSDGLTLKILWLPDDNSINFFNILNSKKNKDYLKFEF